MSGLIGFYSELNGNNLVLEYYSMILQTICSIDILDINLYGEPSGYSIFNICLYHREL